MMLQYLMMRLTLGLLMSLCSLHVAVASQHEPLKPFSVKLLVTGIAGEAISGTNEVWSKQVRHAYSKVQPWNCSEELLWVLNRDDSGTQLFLSTPDFKVKYVRKSPGTELRWSPEFPDQMIYVSNNTVGVWHVAADQTRVIKRFETLQNLRIGPFEGNLSFDGRWLVLTGDEIMDEPVNARQHGSANMVISRSILLNIHSGQVFSSMPHDSGDTIDWVSVSASGKYVVLHNATVTTVFDRFFNIIGSEWNEPSNPSHFDLTIDSEGNDVAVGVSKWQKNDGKLIARRLKDGHTSVLVGQGYARHTSARNTDNEDWVFVTYEGDLEQWPPYSNEVLAVKLDGLATVRVQRIQKGINDYWSQAQTVASPSGRYIAWAQSYTSDSGENNQQVNVGLAVAYIGDLIDNDEPAIACRPAKRD